MNTIIFLLGVVGLMFGIQWTFGLSTVESGWQSYVGPMLFGGALAFLTWRKAK